MLAVRDIMQSDVVTVTPDTTARQLARILTDAEVTGVPVVDRGGSLVGVVSSTDLVRLTAEEAGVQLRAGRSTTGVDPVLDPDELVAAEADEEPDPYGFFLPEEAPFTSERFLDLWTESDFDTVLVRDIMTPVTFTVGPDVGLDELCDFLLRGRIHRAVVVDGNRMVGIVTSVDVLRALAERKVA